MDPSIIWDDEDDEQGNYHHIVTEGHGITQEEVDEVLRAHYSEATTSRTTGNPISFGWTTTGKYIAVVFEESCDDPLMPAVRLRFSQRLSDGTSGQYYAITCFIAKGNVRLDDPCQRITDFGDFR